MSIPTFDVTVYGAVGDGTTDDTSYIALAYAALVSQGYGILYFPPGVYAISSTLNIGNGSGTTPSTTTNVAVWGAGAGSAAQISVGQESSSPSTSRIKWIGASGPNEIVVRINGPIDCIASFSNIEIDGNASAGIGLQELSLSGCTFQNVLIRDCTQAHWWETSNGSSLGTTCNVHINCGMVTTGDRGATIGIVLGGLYSDVTELDSSEQCAAFLNTWLGTSCWLANSTDSVGVDRRYCDGNSFIGGTISGNEPSDREWGEPISESTLLAVFDDAWALAGFCLSAWRQRPVDPNDTVGVRDHG